MKQKDIALIIAVAGFSAIFAFFLSNVFISSAEDRQQTVEQVSAITTEFNEPQPNQDTDDDDEPDRNKYFNEQSINPTRTIRIDGAENENPFLEETE